MRTLQSWNELISQHSMMCQTTAIENEGMWQNSLAQLREIIHPFLDWCEEENLFSKAREFLRANIHRLEPSLISDNKGELFFWGIKGVRCAQSTIEELMTIIEKQLQ